MDGQAGKGCADLILGKVVDILSLGLSSLCRHLRGIVSQRGLPGSFVYVLHSSSQICIIARMYLQSTDVLL